MRGLVTAVAILALNLPAYTLVSVRLLRAQLVSGSAPRVFRGSSVTVRSHRRPASRRASASINPSPNHQLAHNFVGARRGQADVGEDTGELP